MKKTITLTIIILASVLTQLITFLPWWSFLVPVALLGFFLPLEEWRISSFLYGLFAGFLTWIVSTFYFETAYEGKILIKLTGTGAAYYIFYFIIGLIGGLLSGLAFYTGFLLRKAKKLRTPEVIS